MCNDTVKNNGNNLPAGSNQWDMCSLQSGKLSYRRKGEAERLQGVKARGCGRKRGRPRGPAELTQLGEVPLL